jgi:hypothetical protein
MNKFALPEFTYSQNFTAHKDTKVYKHVPSDETVKTVETFYSGIASCYQTSYKQCTGTSKTKDLGIIYKDNIK